MPHFYSYGAEPRRYGLPGAIEGRYTARAAESRGLGDRYTGPVPRSDLGKLAQQNYIGSQEGIGASNFGGQNKDLGAVLLSNNEKTLLAVGVLGLVGWFMFGDKIKKRLKR